MDLNNNMYSLFILVIIIIIIIIIILLLNKFGHINNETNNNNGLSSYYIDTPIKGNATNMNDCLPGCIRGRCNKNINNSCKYDYECHYCRDKNTNMFYVNLDYNHYKNENNIMNTYQKHNKLNYEEEITLNKNIKENNNYIKTLNDKIKKLNN